MIGGTSGNNLYPNLGRAQALPWFLSERRDFLNKGDLIKEVMEKTSINEKDAGKLIDLFFSELTQALVNGERIEIRGLCSFFVKEYEGYIGRNPKTGEKVQVAPKKSPCFKAGKELKERVDYKEN